MPDPSSSAPAPSIPLDALLSVLSSVTRWDILRELAGGTSLMVSELAQRTGNDPTVISKHLAVMRKAGVVINPRGRLFEIAPQFLTDKSTRTVDFGWCLLRLNISI